MKSRYFLLITTLVTLASSGLMAGGIEKAYWGEGSESYPSENKQVGVGVLVTAIAQLSEADAGQEIEFSVYENDPDGGCGGVFDKLLHQTSRKSFATGNGNAVAVLVLQTSSDFSDAVSWLADPELCFVAKDASGQKQGSGVLKVRAANKTTNPGYFQSNTDAVLTEYVRETQYDQLKGYVENEEVEEFAKQITTLIKTGKAFALNRPEELVDLDLKSSLYEFVRTRHQVMGLTLVNMLDPSNANIFSYFKNVWKPLQSLTENEAVILVPPVIRQPGDVDVKVLWQQPSCFFDRVDSMTLVVEHAETKETRLFPLATSNWPEWSNPFTTDASDGVEVNVKLKNVFTEAGTYSLKLDQSLENLAAPCKAAKSSFPREGADPVEITILANSGALNLESAIEIEVDNDKQRLLTNSEEFAFVHWEKVWGEIGERQLRDYSFGTSYNVGVGKAVVPETAPPGRYFVTGVAIPTEDVLKRVRFYFEFTKCQDGVFYESGEAECPQPTSAPVFAPPAGTFTSPQLVTLSSTTLDSVIYYTTDSTTPRCFEHGTEISSGATVGVDSDVVLKAVACREGYEGSSEVSARYTIDRPQVASGDLYVASTWPEDGIGVIGFDDDMFLGFFNPGGAGFH